MMVIVPDEYSNPPLRLQYEGVFLTKSRAKSEKRTKVPQTVDAEDGH
jgi:hypothetical protein